jgi:integrase/recombinase XerD
LWLTTLANEQGKPQVTKAPGRSYAGDIKWCADNECDAVLDRSTVQAFTAALLESGTQPHTARTRQQALRRYSAWLLDEGETDSNELLGTKQPQLDEIDHRTAR